jgi:selenocysteine-specific elongation factor
MTGFGTVVTGTLLDGVVNNDSKATIYPSMLPARIRQIQVHNHLTPQAFPGQRTAINISNLKKDDIHRGDILGSTDALQPTYMLDVTVSVSEKSPYKLKNGRQVQLHLLAKEYVAKLILLGSNELEHGQSGYAQLRLKTPVTARRGDRFVLRLSSPSVTIGGGEVLDGAPLKRKRSKTDIISLFETKEKGTHLERLELAVKERPGSFPSLTELIKRADLDRTKARAEANNLVDKGILVLLSKDYYLHIAEYQNISQKIKMRLQDYHRREPFSPGLPQEQLKAMVMPGAPQVVTEALLERLCTTKLIQKEGPLVRLASFIPQVNEAKNEFLVKLENCYREFALNPQATSSVLPGVGPSQQRERKAALATLVRKGDLVLLDDLYHIHQHWYNQALNTFRHLAQNGQPILVGQFRDALGSSRKVALALLESFERKGLAIKAGEGRLLR